MVESTGRWTVQHFAAGILTAGWFSPNHRHSPQRYQTVFKLICKKSCRTLKGVESLEEGVVACRNVGRLVVGSVTGPGSPPLLIWRASSDFQHSVGRN